MDLLNITGQPYSDSSIEDYQFHSYQSSISGNIGFNDEIRIPIQDLDAYTAPGDSYLYIEGKLLQENGNKPVKLEFINNGVSFLFRELRYELNGIVVDSVRNVVLTSTLINYLSYNENETGFFEDFQKIIVNMKQELVLIRSSNDLDCIYSNDLNELPKITITKLFWKVPHVSVSMSEQLRLTKLLSKNVELPLRFRSWELIEYPALPHSTNHTWPVKTSTKVETPRHVIIAFQENVKGKVNSDMSKFKNCDLKNVRVFLNSERYPYSDLFLSFTSNKFATLYDMFANFQESYYPYKIKQPIFTPMEFNTIAPIAHIDCSHQKEVIQTGSVVVRVEFETGIPTIPDTTALCLILHEKHFTYNPLTKINYLPTASITEIKSIETMNLILDIQGFKVENNKFIVKELAAYDGTRLGHYVFKPPFAMEQLPPDLHKQAVWLTHNHHCIPWKSGFTPLYQFSEILKNLSLNVKSVYVKGKEKTDYIRKYSMKPVYEMDEHPSLYAKEPTCFYHTKNPSVCALANVLHLYDTFIMNDK
ncbi:hypothetical protein NQ317_006780 [Molorchus minor]|uniref:Double jelly roll-like domain-containing protein n=1 Tax=Molorchus minor TaxID=1323400 RepID=A0ABQ9IVI7_9CUCU|nr:hypothetical protein NQ317_006780 [Molorchus minor]